MSKMPERSASPCNCLHEGRQKRKGVIDAKLHPCCGPDISARVSVPCAESSGAEFDGRQNPANLRQQVRQNLAAAGFTDIKVLPESFLVRAKDRSGNPVMMIINPDSVTAVTALNGTTFGNGMPRSQALNLTQQQKQKIAQIVAGQPAEQAPPNFQPSIGQKVPGTLTLKSFPSQSELPASLQGDQYAKLDNNDIIIVDPSSREVVGMINQNSAD